MDCQKSVMGSPGHPICRCSWWTVVDRGEPGLRRDKKRWEWGNWREKVCAFGNLGVVTKVRIIVTKYYKNGKAYLLSAILQLLKRGPSSGIFDWSGGHRLLLPRPAGEEAKHAVTGRVQVEYL